MILRRSLPLGAALRDRSIVCSPRSRVWQAEFAGTPTVVKQIVGGPDAVDRFDRELLALRLAGAGRPRVVPEVLAADRDHRVLSADRQWGTMSARERVVHRLGVAADGRADLAATVRLAAAMREALARA